MTRTSDDLSALNARLTQNETFEEAFLELQQREDPGLYAELLSGASWTDFVRADFAVTGFGMLHPGPLLLRSAMHRGMHRTALNVLLLFLTARAEGPVAAALRAQVLSLQFNHWAWDGVTDLQPLSAFPNLNALRIYGCRVRSPLPGLRLHTLDVEASDGIEDDWIVRTAPLHLRTDGSAVPRSVVRLELTAPAAPSQTAILDCPDLEALTLRGRSALVIRDCPRLRVVRAHDHVGSFTFSAWSTLPNLEVLEIRSEPDVHGAAAKCALPDLPALRELMLTGRPVDLAHVPATVQRLEAPLMDCKSLSALQRPTELRIAHPRGRGGWPQVQDATALITLDLSGRAVSDADLQGVHRSPALQRLHVANTDVTRLDALHGHASLALLDLSGCAELRDVRALSSLPALRVTRITGRCGIDPKDLPSAQQWTANQQVQPDIEALLRRTPPTARRLTMPAGLPKSAEPLLDAIFPLLHRRSFEAIDVAVDAIVAADIPKVWDHWLDGMQSWNPQAKAICPRRFSQAIPDRAYVLHATLRLIGTAPATCAAAEPLRRATTLKLDFGYLSAKVHSFDLSLLAGLIELESVQLSSVHLVVPDSPRPDWLPRLTSLHIHNPRPAPGSPSVSRSGPSPYPMLREQLCRTLPHVRDVQVR